MHGPTTSIASNGKPILRQGTSLLGFAKAVQKESAKPLRSSGKGSSDAALSNLRL